MLLALKTSPITYNDKKEKAKIKNKYSKAYNMLKGCPVFHSFGDGEVVGFRNVTSA